jgi:Arc/MetJ-type ribon-helix-helix transcriptional regulator
MHSPCKLSFCLTAEEAKAVDEARKRLGRHGVLRNRSEVIRAAITYMQQLSDAELRTAAEKTPKLKPGRKRKAPSGL